MSSSRKFNQRTREKNKQPAGTWHLNWSYSGEGRGKKKKEDSVPLKWEPPFSGMTLQRWSKKKKSNNRGKWYSAAEAGSGSEHVGGASADCWCQNVKRKLKWKKRREGRKWGRENGWTSLERGKWSSAEAFIVPEVQWLCSFYSYKQNLYRDIKPKHRPPSLLLLLLLLLFTSAANILKTKHCSHSSIGLLLLLLLLLKIRLCLICAII